MHSQHVQLRVSLTGRYATALFKEALAKKATQKVVEEIHAFEELLRENLELQKLLKNNLVQASELSSIIEKISDLMEFSSLFKNFLKIIIANSRHTLLPKIFRDFQAMIDRQSDTLPVRIEITTLNKKHLKAIEDLIKDNYPSKTYRFEHHESPQLLGGFRAFIRDTCLDYSLKSRLNRLSYQLKEA